MLDKFAKTQGLYKEKELNPKNRTPEQNAQLYYDELIRLELEAGKALTETRKYFNLPTFEPNEEYVN